MKTKNLVIKVISAYDGKFGVLLDCGTNCIVVNVSEKEVDKIILSTDRSTEKFINIMQYIDDNFIKMGIKDIDCIHFKAIIVSKSVYEFKKYLKVLGRVFVPRQDLIFDKYDVSYVRILSDTYVDGLPYKVSDDIILKILNIRAFSKQVIDDEAHRQYIHNLAARDMTISEAKKVIEMNYKQFEGSVSPYNTMLLSIIIDTVIYRYTDKTWVSILEAFINDLKEKSND